MTGPTASGLDRNHAPSIDCLEVREALSASSHGVGLTEWALVHAHVARCPDCQKQREALQLAVNSQRVEPFHGAMLAASVATSIERARVLIARAPHLLMPLRSSAATAFRGTARGARETAGVGATRALGLLSRLGALATIALIASRRAGVRLVERAGATFTRVGRRMLLLIAASARAGGHVIGGARFRIARVPDVAIGLRAPLTVAVRRTAHAARQTAGAGTARALGLVNRLGALASISLTASMRAGAGLIERSGATLTRVGRRMPLLVAPSARAVGHAIGRARLGITRVPAVVIGLGSPLTVLVRSTTHVASRAAGAGVAQGVGWLDRLGVLGSSLTRSTARAVGDHPRACAAIAALAILVPSLLLLWPLRGPDDLVRWFSGRGQLSRELSAPVERKPAGPAAPVPFVVTAPPGSGPGAPPAPVVAPRSQTSPVAVSHVPAEIPAPARRRAPAPAPPPSVDAPGNVEAADSTAAIDWLLQGGRSRRQAESP